jgi:hypothetical protein
MARRTCEGAPLRVSAAWVHTAVVAAAPTAAAATRSAAVRSEGSRSRNAAKAAASVALATSPDTPRALRRDRDGHAAALTRVEARDGCTSNVI